MQHSKQSSEKKIGDVDKKYLMLVILVTTTVPDTKIGDVKNKILHVSVV